MHHRILRQALQHAVHENLLPFNPAARVKAPKKQRAEFTVLSETEALRFLENLRGTRYYIPALLALLTGMRRGEILALRWRDVELEKATLVVRYSLEQTREGLRFKEPKSAASIRPIGMPASLVSELKSHRAEQAGLRLSLGAAWLDHDLVCPGLKGHPWKPDTFSSNFTQVVRRFDMPRVRFHDLRHTHASLLLRQNVHTKITSGRLGHSSVAITMDLYSHLLPGMDRDAADQLDGSLAMAREQLRQDEHGQIHGQDANDTGL